jgi:hypothetical protein
MKSLQAGRYTRSPLTTTEVSIINATKLWSFSKQLPVPPPPSHTRVSNLVLIVKT